MLRIATLLTLFLSFPLNAEPVVLFDSGRTVPAYPYKQILQGIDIPDFGEQWARQKAKEVDQSTNPADPASWLPVITNKLSPGAVKSRAAQFNQLASPVCVIGSDDQSLDWIKKYQAVLKDNNVLCWLVQAEHLDDVQRVISALQGIAMSPADGNAIADFFSIKHYPVLITQRFIEQ